MPVIGPEYLKPLTAAGLPPTMFQRFGPTLLAPPFVKVWQAAHFFATFFPASILALARRFVTGSGPAGASDLAATAWGSFVAIA